MVCSYCDNFKTKNHRSNACPYYLNTQISRTKKGLQFAMDWNDKHRGDTTKRIQDTQPMEEWLEKCQKALYKAEKNLIVSQPNPVLE